MVTVFLANGFEEMEALAPIDLLRREGVKVQTAAVGTNPAMHGGKVVTGSHGVRCCATLPQKKFVKRKWKCWFCRAADWEQKT